MGEVTEERPLMLEDTFGIGRHHSIDGLGVRRWRGYVAGGSQEVSLFDRPNAKPRFMLRIMTRGGKHVSTRYRTTERGIVNLLKREGLIPGKPR
jgi:hypothetical protein